MRPSLFFSIFSSVVVATSVWGTKVDMLRINVIAGRDGISQIECWSLLPGFVVSSQPGTIGSKQIQLGLIANGSYTIFPSPGPIDAGLHNAPTPQWVVTLSGNGTVTFPNNADESLAIPAGSVIIAVDTANTSKFGHRTVWEGGSIVVQLPFRDGFIPAHNTSKGACKH